MVTPSLILRGRALTLIIAFVAGIVVSAYGLHSGSHRLADFAGYFGAARILAEGNPAARLYDDVWFTGRLAALGINEPTIVMYVNPPTVALPVFPLTACDPIRAKMLWGSGTLLFVFASWWLITQTLAMPPLSARSLLLLAGCLASIPLMRTLQLGQMYGLILLLFAGAFHRYQAKDHRGMALLLALGFVLKLYGWMFLILFLLQRRLRMVFWSAAAMALVTAISVLVFGADAYAAQWERIASLRGAVDTASLQLRSVVAPLSRLFVFHPDFNPGAVAHLPWIPAYGPPLLLLVALIATFRKPLGDLYAFSAVVVLSVLFTPLAADHHYLLLLIPAATVLAAPPSGHRYAVTGGVLFLLAVWHPLPSATLAQGWGSLLAYGRLYSAGLFWWIVVLQGRHAAERGTPPATVNVASVL